jgi:hypothetical protein
LVSWRQFASSACRACKTLDGRTGLRQRAPRRGP